MLDLTVMRGRAGSWTFGNVSHRVDVSQRPWVRPHREPTLGLRVASAAPTVASATLWPMSGEKENEVGADILTLRFVGEDSEGHPLHELRAAHVAQVLEGIVGLAGDFGRAGAFGEGPPPEVLVRPPSEGSFVIEVVNWFGENKDLIAAGGVPSLGSVLWWATKSIRADVTDFDYLDNGNVKVKWTDDTADEIPRAAWAELNKRQRRRKSQLRKILAPLSDGEVTALKVSEADETVVKRPGDAPEEFTLERVDYHLARPEDEVEEAQRVFESEAQMSAIDFESAERWRVRTAAGSRSVTVEDSGFLARVDRGLAIHKDDIFTLSIREDSVTKNGQTRRTWTVLEVKGQRKRSGDVDDA